MEKKSKTAQILEEINARLEEAKLQAERDAWKHIEIVGRATVIIDFASVAREYPEEWKRQQQIIKRFADAHLKR